MPHEPFKVPVFCVPKSISVVPDIGRLLNIFILGILTEDEQSKVPFVLNLRIVGMPAFAILFRGVYPPFA